MKYCERYSTKIYKQSDFETKYNNTIAQIVAV